MQLSLPLTFSETKPPKEAWFQEMLQSLDISYEPTWADKFGLSLRNWLNQHGHSPIKTLSLFSGCGGLDIGFHDAGFDIVHMVELEAKYVQTLLKNSQPGKWLENSQPICIDIKEFSPSPDLDVDFIIGGPPCQTFSAAGRRASGVAGTSDVRGSLFEEYVRLLETLQPKGFLFENVYGITGVQKGEAWTKIQNAFKKAGYNIHFRVLDAADYGVPQHRERLFIVGLTAGSYLFPYPTHGPDSPNQEPFYTSVRFLSIDFGWTEYQVANSLKVNLKYDLNNSNWLINAQVSDCQEENDNKYTIEIFLNWRYENWVLDTNSVKLCGNELDKRLFTALWKAFEEKLLQITGMADLVQLSGYYQYKPKISGRLTFDSSVKVTPFWQILQCVVSGIGVASQVTEEKLALLWGVEIANVFSYLHSLRSIGYEVRNHNTNPQIPRGEYLIPYAFPTLTPKSVQLRKTLGQSND